jgi:hypothetical protein
MRGLVIAWTMRDEQPIHVPHHPSIHQKATDTLQVKTSTPPYPQLLTKPIHALPSHKLLLSEHKTYA